MTEHRSDDSNGAAFYRALQLIDHPDAAAARTTEIATTELAAQAGPLGLLARLAGWTAGVQACSPPRDFERVRAIVIAGDHGIAQAGVSSRPVGYTADEVGRVRAGGGLVNMAAGVARATVRPVDVSVDISFDTESSESESEFKVRRASNRIDREDALSNAEVWRAIDAGIRLADAEIDAGTDLLVVGNIGAGSTTVAATLISVLTGTEPARVVGRSAGIDDATWSRKCAAVRDARRRGMPVRSDLPTLLATVTGADVAAMVGLLAQAAARRTPVVLDGVVAAAAALAVHSQRPQFARWIQAGERSAEPAHELALERMGLAPITDFGIGTGGAVAALLCVPVLRAAIRSISSANV